MTIVHSNQKISPIRIQYGIEAAQFGDLYLPDASLLLRELSPVMILIHGGYWKDNHDLNSYATSQLIPELVAFGWAVWNIEYQRMDSIGDNLKAPWPRVFADVAMAVDSLRLMANTYLIDLHNVSAIGHSAGGCLALWAANRRQIAVTSPLFTTTPLFINSVMSIGGVLSLTHPKDLCQPEQIMKLMGGSEAELPERYRACDPSQLFDTQVRTMIIHGEKDNTVNIHQALHYAEAAPTNIQLDIWPEADHFSMLPHSGVWSEHQWQLLLKHISQFFLSRSDAF